MSRVALITGASGGIGSATCKQFRAEGWRVFAVDRRVPDPTACCEAYLIADVSRQEDCELAVAETLGACGRIDALVNNAAIQLIKDLVDTSTAEWESVLSSNLTSAFLMMRAAYSALQACGSGAIVSVSSVHAVATSRGIGAYAVSKGALTALTRSAAIEFAASGIRVNAVLPGAVDTPMLRAGLVRGEQSEGAIDDRLLELCARTPCGRVADPVEIARGITFLADYERSSFITGQSLIIDGGVSSRLCTE